MKKILISLLAVCILLTACSSGAMESKGETPSNREEISVRVNAPKRVESRGELMSSSGICKIDIDADVIIPKATALNVYEAKARAYTNEEIEAYFNHIKKNADWNQIDILNEIKEVPTDRITPYKNYELYVSDDKLSSNQGGKYTSFKVSYSRDKKTDALAFMQTFNYENAKFAFSGYDFLPLKGEKAKDCTISLEEAIKIADKEVAVISKDYKLSAYGQSRKSDVNKQPEVYSFVYTKHFGGIAVGNVMSMTAAKSEEYGYIAGQSAIAVLVDDDGVCYLSYDNPMDTTGVLEKDVELLPFADILDIYKKLAILSMQAIEVDNPDLQEYKHEVYEIRFSYMSVPLTQKQDAYKYVPVWDFYIYPRFKGVGGYAYAAENPSTEPFEVGFTINAIDGTVIDRDMGY